MARFHVYRVRGETALALDVQADLLDQIKTRVVVPLIPLTPDMIPIARLNPVLSVLGQSFLMRTQALVAIPVSELTDDVADLSNHQDKINSAIDFLLQGF